MGPASLIAVAQASADISTTINFSPADSSRTHMDVGGAWGGTADVTAVGDRFDVVIANTSSTESAFDLVYTADLPIGFVERTNSLNLSLSDDTCGPAPSPIVSRNTDTLEFDFGGYDLPENCSLSLDFGVVAPASAAAGTYTVSGQAKAASVDGGTSDVSNSASESFIVQQGAAVLKKSPSVATQTFGSMVTWDISVTNSGLGGLFDVELDESGLGAGLTLQAITSTAPTSPTPSIDGSVLSIPYLAPGETLSGEVSATVTQCVGLTNSVSLSERNGAISDIADASVQLDLQSPFVSLSFSTAPIAFESTGTITVDIDNTGDGSATNLVIDTSLENTPLGVVSVSPGWTYTPSTGRITRMGPLAAGADDELVITVQDTVDVCTAPGSVSFTAIAEFKDECGVDYTTPAQVSSISSQPEPSVSLDAAGIERLTLGQSSTLTLTASAVNAASLSTDPVPVTYTLPGGIQDGAILSPSAGSALCSGLCGAGDAVTWTIPRADFVSGPQTLTIAVAASDEPCDAGMVYSGAGSISAEYFGGACSDADGAGHDFILSTSPQAAVSQEFNVAAEPFETGAPDDGDTVREEGEGEEGAFLAQFGFPASDTGVWVGSTYHDDFGGLTGVSLTSSSLEYQFNSGAWTAVPGGSVSLDPAGFTIDLSFMAGVDVDGSVAGDDLNFRYTATATDSVFISGRSIRIEQFSTLTVQGGSEGASACVPGPPGTVEYGMGDYVTWQRAVGNLSVSLSDSVIDVCEVVNATVSVGNETNQLPIRNLLASLGLGSDYELVDPSTPTNSGGLGSGASVTFSGGASGEPTVLLNDTTLSSNGSMTIPIRRKATSTSEGGGVTARIDYDDNETAPAGGQSFNATASANPLLIRSANLELFVTPTVLPVSSDTAQWVLTVTNTGSGTAFGAQVSDTVPPGMTITSANVSAMDGVNGAYAASAFGDTVEWTLGDLPPGESVDLTVVATVDGTTCTVPAGSNSVDALWGCGGVTSQTQVSTRPDLTFPSGNIQILHDTTGAYASLCGTGQIVLIVRNAGASEVRDVSLQEALDTASTGMSLVPNSVEYSTNDGANWTSASGVTAASTLVFNSTNIPALALLGPFGTATDEVLIRFAITTDARTNENSSASVSGSGFLHCGDPATSPASVFSVPLDRPDIRVRKTGRNTTTGTSLSETVYGRPGDTIEWRVEVTNNGTLATSELRIRDLLAGSGGTATITGGGLTNDPVTSSYIDVDEIAAGATTVFTITEVLGSTCANGSNIADVTWGCAAQSVGSASELSSPTDNSDGASLSMRPSVPDVDLDIEVTALGGAGAPTLNGEVTVIFTNNGAPFTDAEFTVTLPVGYVVDTSQTPTFSNSDTTSDRVTAASLDASTPIEPKLTLSDGAGGGWVRHGAEVSVTFPIIATGISDTTSDGDVRTESTSDSTDPAPLATDKAQVRLDFESACSDSFSANASTSVDPKTPDLDIDITDPLARVVTAKGDTTSIDVVITNNGDTQADNGAVRIVTGAGWSGPAPTGCMGSIPGTLTCALDGVTALGEGASRTFTLDLTVDNETSPLSLSATVEGSTEDAAGTDTELNYSLDQITARVLGFRQTLDLYSTSEADFDAPADLQIGEDAILRLTSVWFGGGSETVSNAFIDLDFQANNQFAYLSETGSAFVSSLLAPGATGPTQTYALADFTGGLTHVLDIAVRALDDTANSAGATFDFVSEATSDFLGSTFDATSADYPAAADRTETFTTERPVLVVTKAIRNVTASGNFAESATGDAGDVIAFQVVISNSGTAPAFDLDIKDALPAGLTIVPFSADTLDNDGDGDVDEAAEGDIDGQALTFNTAEVGGTHFDVLAASGSITLLYQATVDATVNPDEQLINDAQANVDTLTGATGGQVAPIGANGTALGGAILTASNTATLTIDALALTKDLVVTSVGGDDSLNVVVGEQADFQLQIVLPAGTVEDFVVEDDLPEGLALVARQAPIFGSGITNCTSPTLSPSALPAAGIGLTAEWDFGTCNVADTTAENRTITLVYTGQIENDAAVNAGDALPNFARYDHSRIADPVEVAPVTLSVGEPDLGLTLDISPGSNIDAGDLLTYSYVLSNSGTAPAYNIDLFTLLNDNGAAGGANGDVNMSAVFGDALRDVVVFDCAIAPSDTTAAPGDFVYSFDGADGDGDASDEAEDCGILHRNISVDGLAAGASLTFSFEATTSEEIILRSSLIGEGVATGTSLPAGAPGQGNNTYERSANADTAMQGNYSATASDTFSTRAPANTQKTFTATSDANTAPDSGDAIDIAIGETYTARVTYRFDEGTSRAATLRERVRVQNANDPAEVELLAARLERSSTDLTAGGDPAGINSTAVGAQLDVTSLVTQSENASYKFFDLSMGDVLNAGNAGTPATGRNIDAFTVEYDLRVRDASSNAEGAFIDDQGQTRLRDAEDSLLTTNGQTRRATLVEPDMAVIKTSADSDGLLEGNETVRYTITATNHGTGPAYNAVLQDVLPPALRANGVTPVSVLIDGVSPVTAPVFTYNAASGIAQWTFADADVLLPLASIQIVYDATADTVISPGTTHTNTFEVAAVFSQASNQPIERRQSPRSPQATVTLGAPEIAFYPDHREATQPGSTIIYPHLVDIPVSLTGAKLDFTSVSSRNLEWEVWYDADGNRSLSGGDTLWINGSTAPTGEALQFFLRSQIPSEAHDGYRDTTTFTAAVTLGTTVLNETVTDITTVSRLQAGELVAGKFMALDRDCDGDLADEISADALFEITKNADPGDCVVFRITYRNDGTGDVSDVDVRDQVPAYTLYRGGSAGFEVTPSGLTRGTVIAPGDGSRGALAFPYTGTVEPGEEGSVVYGVRVEQ